MPEFNKISEIPDGWCAYHNEVEETPEGSTTCFECWHTFKDDQAIVDAYNEWGSQYLTVKEVDKIFSCPVCSHDW